MALEQEARLLRRGVKARLLDPDKGTAALMIYSQLLQRGVHFTFGEFLVDRGLLTQAGLDALLHGSGTTVRAVSAVGDFELQEVIGEGQAGTVFKAVQKSLNRTVAVKVLKPEFAADRDLLERFVSEARTTAKLNHPHVVQGIDVGSDQGLHYFAMELVDGGSARALLEQQGGILDERTALELTRQAAEGLKAAHTAGIVHRDLKPDNILMSQDGQAKLADLGLSVSGYSRNPAEAGIFWGSPPYVAPEVIRGTGESDPRSDIYSLGAMLFEFLTGRPPYVADTPHEVLQLHLNAPIPEPQTLNPALSIQVSALVKRMLAKDPAERVPTTAAVADALNRLLALPPEAPPPPPAEPEPPPRPSVPPRPGSHPSLGRVPGRRPPSTRANPRISSARQPRPGGRDSKRGRTP